MKKIIIFGIALLIVFTIPVQRSFAVSLENELNNKLRFEKIDEIIESFVFTYDNAIVDAIYETTLKDVFGSKSFGLFRIEDKGYAVVTLTNMSIVEINVDGQNSSAFLASTKYYLGPNIFMSTDDFNILLNEEQSTMSSQLIDPLTNRVSLDAVRETTRKILAEQNDFIFLSNEGDNLVSINMSPIIVKPAIIVGGSEVGQYSDSSMALFKNEEWHNDNDGSKDYLFNFLGFEFGICGTISTAMALTVLDKYKNTSIIVNQPYQYPDPNYAEWLIMLLKPKIEPPLPGSFGSDIISGINWFYSSNYSSRISPYFTPVETSSESIYMTSIQNGIPTILYLDVVDSNLSPYGLHWVMAYKYVNYNGALWFKAADNWGNLAWINRNWIGSAVYFKYY
jgi:hypothetical protein